MAGFSYGIDALRAGLDFVDAPAVLLDPERCIVAVNEAFTARTGLSTASLAGHSGSSFLAPGDRGGETARELAGTELDIARMTRSLRHPDGSTRTSLVTVRRVRDEAGATVGFVATLVDASRVADELLDAATAERTQRDVLDAMSVAIVVDRDATIVYANKAALELFGATGYGELSRHLAGLVPQPGGQGPVPARSTRFVVERADGTRRIIDRTVQICAVGGEACRLSTMLDVTALAHATSELQRRSTQHRELLDGLPIPVLAEVAGIQVYSNPAMLELLGCRDHGELVRMLAEHRHVHPDERARLQERLTTYDPMSGPDVIRWRIVRTNGAERVTDWRTMPTMFDGQPALLFAVIDVTEAVSIEQSLAALAHSDTLTGLVNRRALAGAVEARLAAGTPTALLFCDLDGFKQVNDDLGHDAGDEVLRTVAQRIRHAVRDDDVVARFAGDEFVIVVDPEHALVVRRRLQQVLERPIGLRDGREANVRLSVGLTVAQRGDDLDVLIRRADAAMYRDKAAARGATPDPGVPVHRRVRLVPVDEPAAARRMR